MSSDKPCLQGAPMEVWPVTDVHNPMQLIMHCMPAFGAGFVRRIVTILDRAIGEGIPLIMSFSGPVTISNQHRAWLIPLLETGWFGYITTTDAACYHDGHDSLHATEHRPIFEVPIEGSDLELRDAGIIRVTDAGFAEQVLFDQDRVITAILQRPEFQKRMTGTEFRNRLGKYYGAMERLNGIKPGLLSTCYEHSIPVFVGAPGDGSAFLNSVKLWAMSQLGQIEHRFDIDVHAEVFESCAYHFWGLMHSAVRKLGIIILGGGVPKNFSLQPEPTLSQIFCLPDIRGYDYDVQIVGAPVTDGSLTSCKPAEAHTWGKVSAEALAASVESYQADYSTLMPLIAWALLDKRRRLMNMRDELGLEELCRRHPEATGYLREDGQLRLFDRRDELVVDLLSEIGTPDSIARMRETLDWPLPVLEAALS